MCQTLKRYCKQFSVGLTGGIASGKTIATDYFRSLGVTVIDADEVSREITADDQPAVDLIAKQFGQSVLKSAKSLDREKLREMIFNNKENKRLLEQMLHPLIQAKMQQLASQSTADYVIFSIPLLLETNQENRFDRILIIDAPLEKRKHWLKVHRQLDERIIDKILNSQVNDAKRIDTADDIVNNDSTIAQLEKQIRALHSRYLNYAKKHDLTH